MLFTYENFSNCEVVTLIANLTDEERRAPRTPRIRSRKCTRVFGRCIFEKVIIP